MKEIWFKIGYCCRWRKWARRGILAGLLLLSSLLLAVTPTRADIFYTGGIHIDSLSATIDITSQATVSVEYELVNHGNTEETVNLSVFPLEATAHIDGAELSNPVDFEAGQVRKLTLLYSIELSSGEFQRIRFAPMLFFNDMVNAQRVKSYSVQLLLPEGVNRLVSSSLPYDSSAIQEGRLMVTWDKDDIYPSTLNVSWTTLDVDIAAVKKATPSTLTSAGEIVEVEITIQNKGDNEVKDISLVDSFFPGAFEAVEPLDEFELVESEMSDPRLYWKKEIDSLEPGETALYSYSVEVEVLGLETRLDPLVVLINDTPVSVSNDIILYSELGEIYPGEAPEEAVGGCFIATATYGTPMEEEIEILREFRDEYLLTNPLGRALVDFYYEVSPPIAEFIDEHPSLKPIVRAGLLPAVAMSAVAINTSTAEKIAIVGLLVLVSVAVTVWATRRRRRGLLYT